VSTNTGEVQKAAREAAKRQAMANLSTIPTPNVELHYHPNNGEGKPLKTHEGNFHHEYPARRR
jgi:hypothetical protein